MKVVIVAGGTGGHFYPGLAVAKEFQAQRAEVSFLVRKNDYVIPLLRRENIPFAEIAAAGFNRRWGWHLFKSVFDLTKGFFQSFLLLQREKPDVVLAMGGYLSFPPVLCAKLLRIGIFLHEQNVRPGLANRLLGRLATRVALSFPESRRYFRGDSVVTGNPVRPEFKQLTEKYKACALFQRGNKGPVILAFGGSLGAHRLNELMVEAAVRLNKKKISFELIHITGAADEIWVREEYEKSKVKAFVAGFCHDMPSAYAAADVVVCRAGATSIAELMSVKKPALLIPYPHATGNHQLFNARVLEKWGAAKVLEEKFLDPFRLKTILRKLIDEPNLLEEMRNQYAVIDYDPLSAAKKILQMVMVQGG